MNPELMPLHRRVARDPGELQPLLQRVDEIEALQKICRRWSSEPWMGALRVVNVRGQTLVVHAESAAALTALRYRREALLAYLREHGRWPLTRLETRVRPALPGRGV